VASDALRRALRDSGGGLNLRPLPTTAEELLVALDAPPRLAAHLRAVHDVAVQLVDWLEVSNVRVDRATVELAASLHDIGKVLHPAELHGPGSAHEAGGYRLLLDRGYPEVVARIVRDHAHWNAESTVESLVVSLADKVWKDKRVEDLEQIVVDRVAAATGRPQWEVFAAVDDHLTAIGRHAVQRLAFQNTY
jgi:putative nucleotidyltransferase with HDIG domain